ncbi:DLA class II histocompatibility antigen, DR-1 beta chain-like isoform X2 [Pristis pectinata]|uniref:DLA class II histocompatibility antigen, DR-1 beta chain-like isoform X2 n=1 Tax=Pristis pectinata TaxID=685728 RepID=UPI00223CC0D7|nr:DLA class II histocompatibility antigen, DR-1 beta chain-like isoform X2 [Pristis pectinata]
MRRPTSARLLVVAVALVVFALLLRGSAAQGMHIAQMSFSGEGSEFSMAVLRFAYNGEELIHFNYTTTKFVATNPLAEPYADELNHNKRVLKNVARYIHYMPFILEVVEQAIQSLTVKPSITIIPRHLKEEENVLALTCKVDGFYPRAIDTAWLRNGEVIDRGVLKSSVLPNKDGTYQIRLQVNVDPSEGNTYACRVKHLSVTGNLNEVWVPKNKNMPVYGYVVGVIAGIIGILIALSGGIIKWKEVRSQGEADRLCEEVGQLPTLTL